jgi:phenylacetate-CoA ligase
MASGPVTGAADHARVLLALRRHLRASRDEVAAFQADRLRALVAHAWERVPHYRCLLERHGLTPSDIRHVSDLVRIPMTSRGDVQAAGDRLVARGVPADRLLVKRTGGSTGMPIAVRRTWLEERLHVAVRLRALHRLGLRATDRRAAIRFGRDERPDHDHPQRVLRALGLYRRLDIDCLLDLEEIAARLARFRPQVILGYPTLLARLADRCGPVTGALRPRFVATGAEVLTARMRARIAAGFGAPVFDLYGANEFKLIAWQCPETGDLHVNDDSVIVEVCRDGRPVEPGEAGEVVGTALHAYAMPFIRYRLGDLAVRGASSCPCGLPFSTLRVVQGRMVDHLTLPDGRVLHPYHVTEVALDVPWLGQYCLIQERRDLVRVEVVPRRPPVVGDVDALRARLAALLGPGVDVRVALVPDIAAARNGRFRVLRSEVHSEYAVPEPVPAGDASASAAP